MRRVFQVSIFALALFAHSGHAEECPELTAKDIGDAACASPDHLYSTGKLAHVRFIAMTPCPSGMWKKKFQALIKGNKTYSGEASDLQQGKVRCSYALDDNWKKVLGRNDLVLETQLPTRMHANYWNLPLIGAKCPMITKQEVEQLKTGEIDVVTKGEGQSLTYHFEVVDHKKPGFFKGIKDALSGSVDLKRIPGTDALVEPYSIQCKYVHHTGGEETKLTLFGSTEFTQPVQ